MEGLPCAIEFRNQTWFYPEMRDKTLQFLEQEKWIHTICDEPQAGIGSVPLVLEVTNSDMALIRFHGRNVHGWLDKGENWRAVRCLYRYNNKELEEWVERLEQLKKKTKDIYVLFNNNSGGDAADNAKQLMKMMNITYGEPKPEQLNFLNDIKQERHCTNRGMYSAFLYEKEGNNVTERLVDSSIVGFHNK